MNPVPYEIAVQKENIVQNSDLFIGESFEHSEETPLHNAELSFSFFTFTLF